MSQPAPPLSPRSSPLHDDNGESPTDALVRSRSSSASSLSSIFETALTTIFDSLPVATSARAPGKPVVHRSERLGDLSLYLPDVDTEKERELQSHLLWPAGVRLSQMIEQDLIDVAGQSVVELGAGAGLPSLTSALLGAARVVITDYPSPSILSAIAQNVDSNIAEPNRTEVLVRGLDWTAAEDVVEELKGIQPNGFTRILLADTLWMSHLHAAQLDVVARLLSRSPEARIHLIAGLHSGRPCVRRFLRLATQIGLRIISGQEVDRTSPVGEGEVVGAVWETSKDNQDDLPSDEDPGTEMDRRKWLVVAELGWEL